MLKHLGDAIAGQLKDLEIEKLRLGGGVSACDGGACLQLDFEVEKWMVQLYVAEWRPFDSERPPQHSFTASRTLMRHHCWIPH